MANIGTCRAAYSNALWKGAVEKVNGKVAELVVLWGIQFRTC